MKTWLRVAIGRSGAIALGVVCGIGLALAVVGNVQVQVKDGSGAPIPGATIRLQSDNPAIPGAVVTTDETGSATIRLEEGPATMVVEHDGKEKRVHLVIPAGGTLTQTVTMPGGAGSGPHSGPSVGVSIIGRKVKDGEITLAWDRLIVNGDVQNVSEGDLDQLNEQFDHALDLRLYGVDFAWSFDRRASGDDSGFVPMVRVALGRGDLSTTFERNVGEGPDNEFDDGGLYWGLGASGVWQFPSRWFVGAAGQYDAVSNITAKRSPPVGVGGGGTLRKDEAEVDYKAWSLQGYAGHSFERWSPYAGIRYTDQKVELNGTVIATFPGDFTTRIEFVNEIEQDAVLGVAGADFRLTDRLNGGVSVSSDGDDTQWGLGLSFRFGSF